MFDKIEKSYQELVELKYQLYNSLFLTLPFDAIEHTGLLLPLLQDACQRGYEKKESPTHIINGFFEEQKPGANHPERNTFLFKIIQYVERQILLIDALEESAYNKIHRISNSDKWERISEKSKNQNIEDKLKKLIADFGIRVVLTAHPTQFYPGRVLAIASDLSTSIHNGDLALSRDLLQQLGKTPFFRKQKPTVLDEAISLSWYLGNVFYPAIGELLDKIDQNLSFVNLDESQLISLGFWPGGDRDGNPFVNINTTRKVANHLRYSISNCYFQEIKELKRRLSFEGVYEIINHLESLFYAELTNSNGNKALQMDYLLEQLNEIERLLIENYNSLFLDKLKSFKRKLKIFGFYFASIDIRQDSRVINQAFLAVVAAYPHYFPKGLFNLTEDEQINVLVNLNGSIDSKKFGDELIKDTIESFTVIKEIQQKNGEAGAHRYIISNCRTALDIAKVFTLARLAINDNEVLSLDIVPLFETIDDLKNAGMSMSKIYSNLTYKKHLANRKQKQTLMLGFSDGTKDGGYLMANWAIYRAKEDVTEISRNYGVNVIFFDGRGGPPARGGGNMHLFYSGLGKTIESSQIQLTIQGQTISSHYGIKEAAIHNLSHLLTAGIENNLFNKSASNLSAKNKQLIEQLAEIAFTKYSSLKNHPLFIPFLEERTTLKYYGLTNIGSRPSKRGSAKKLNLEDLRAIPFVGAWSQLKQNVPGFFGLGTALKISEDKGKMQSCIDLYKSSVFFKALITNSMQSMSKTNFNITRYMENDQKFGEFWKIIYTEFLLTKKMVLKVSGHSELLEDNARSRMSIKLRERVVLPLLTIQQYALIEIQNAQKTGNIKYVKVYEQMVMRSLFGNINASRNSV